MNTIITISRAFGSNGREIGKRVAEKLNISTVYSELLPNEKVEAMEEIISAQTNGAKTIFVGDGINDAPVLAIKIL